jgi:HK97 gp10 family phage protein
MALQIVQIQGLEEVNQKVKNVEEHIAKSGSLIKKAAVVCQAQAIKNATGRPGPRVLTGRLRGSITYQIVNPQEAKVGTNVEYAPYVEFGHKAGGGSFVPAYPFLGPVVEQVKDQLPGVYISFDKELKGIWEK